MKRLLKCPPQKPPDPEALALAEAMKTGAAKVPPRGDKASALRFSSPGKQAPSQFPAAPEAEVSTQVVDNARVSSPFTDRKE
jgi:hypothetical protein